MHLFMPRIVVDGGTAWMARDSVMLESDTVDAAHGNGSWLDLALQLKQDLASIILMCEEDRANLFGTIPSEVQQIGMLLT